jgi:TP901 family phage tail tape measure protein
MAGAGGSIFMDIMPRLEQTSLGAVINGITSRMSKLGSETGATFGKDFGAGATAGAERMRAQLETSMRAAQLSVEKSMEGMIQAQNRMVTSAGKVEAAQLRVNEMTAKFGAESSKAVTAANNLTRAQQQQATASREAAKATEAEVTAKLNLEAATRRQTEAATASAASSEAVAAGATKAGLAISAGFAIGIGVAINKAGDFEASQTRLVTSAGETASNLKTVSDGLLQMAGAVGFSAQQLSAGMYTIESAGYHGADGLTVLKAAAQGSKNENADLKETTDAVTTALHDYHMGADQAALVMSKMQVAVSQGKTTLQDFAGSLHSVQPIAAAAGISINDLYGTLAAMTASGESADQATQHMADAIRHLANPTTQMTEELSQLGINSADLQQHLGERGLAGSMQAISDAITAKMGPAGTLAVNAFNQSQIAARDAQVAFDHLPPTVQGVAQAVKDGTLSFAEYRKTGGGLAVEQKSQLDQWLSLDKRVTGFSAAIKSGKSDIQTYQSAMALATGDMSSMDVALMVGGENAEKTSQNIAMVAATTTNADGSVKGWEETQNTFNQRMSEFKASIGATAIEIGTNFLPAATDAAHVLGDVGNWLSQNKGFMDALIISIGVAVAAFLTFKTVSAMWTVMNIGIEAAAFAMGLFTVAEEGATVGAGGLAAALAATGISEVVLGITALVAVIAGLVVGVKYAYDHWGWFKTAVDAVWGVLKGIGEWIGSAAVAVWHVLEKAIGPVETAFKAVGSAAMWLWHNVIEPVSNGVSTALRVVGAVVLTVLAVPFVLAFKLIEAAIKFVWNDVIKPTFNLIAAIFHWLYDNAIQPVIDFIKLEIHAWGEVFSWLYDHIVEPVFHTIGDIFHWLYDNAIKPTIDLIKLEIHAWGEVFSWVHDSVIKPIGDGIGLVMGGIKDAFKGCVDWIETQWNRIVGIVGPPIRFIIDSVYNEGIVPVWNDVAGVFGLGKLDKVDGSFGAGGGGGGAGGGSVPVSALAATHAGGGVWQGAGVLPGYAPGKDVHNAILSPGEGVAVPELVQAIGPQRFMALNYAYSGGRKPGSGPAFDAGGVFGGIGNAIGNVVGGAENAVKSEFNMAKFMAKLTADPVGAVKDLFSDALGKASGAPGDPSSWLDMAKGIPGKVVDSVIDKAKGFLSLGGAGTPFVGTPDLMGWIAQAEQITGVGPGWTGGLQTLIGRESGGNPNAINNTDVNAKNGDPSRGLMQTIGSTFERYRDSSLPDNIYDPVANIVAGINYIKSQYGGIENVQQANPTMPPKGYAGGGIVGYAGGGVKPPADRSAIDRGLSWLHSQDGKPYNADGWLDCSGLISGLYDTVIGRPVARAFNTVSDFLALGFKKGTGGIFDIGVTPKPGDAGHMAATFDGHRAESSGSHGIAIDGQAIGADDGQFPDHYYLPGTAFFPKYTGTDAKPDAADKSSDKLNADVTKWTNAAQKAQQMAQTETDAATKHDQAADKHLADAAKSDDLAAKAVGAAKQKHIDAANRSRQEADTSRAAAQKSRDLAAKHTQQAQDDQAKADQAKTDAQTVGSSQQPLSNSGSNSTGSTGTNSGLVQPMSFHDLTSRLGGIAGDAFLQTTGFKDPLQTPVGKIAQSLAGAKFFQYDLYAKQAQQNQTGTQQAQTPQAQTIPAPGPNPDDNPPDVTLHDEGGWLMPGLNLNLTKKPEAVLAPREKDNLEAIAKSGVGNSGMKGMVVIENQHVNGGDGRAVGRDIYREMLAYQGPSGR